MKGSAAIVTTRHPASRENPWRRIESTPWAHATTQPIRPAARPYRTSPTAVVVAAIGTGQVFTCINERYGMCRRATPAALVVGPYAARTLGAATSSGYARPVGDSRQTPRPPSRDAETELEILGYRDTIFGQKVTIANLEWRLRDTEERLRQVARHRNEMLRSATWKVGRIVMAVFWPIRKVRAVVSPRAARKNTTR
jgi:hypothetical protein